MVKTTFRGVVVRTFEMKRMVELPYVLKWGQRVYAIRHAENDWGLPVTIEKFVCCNFFGTMIADESLEKFFKKDGYIPLSRKEAYALRGSK